MVHWRRVQSSARNAALIARASIRAKRSRAAHGFVLATNFRCSTTLAHEVRGTVEKFLRLLIAFALVPQCAPRVRADEPPKTPAMPTAAELFADQPKDLSDYTVAWKLLCVSEVLGHPVGGEKQGAVFEGCAKFGIGVNLDRALGWEGASLYANILYPHGASHRGRLPCKPRRSGTRQCRECCGSRSPGDTRVESKAPHLSTGAECSVRASDSSRVSLT